MGRKANWEYIEDYLCGRISINEMPKCVKASKNGLTKKEGLANYDLSFLRKVFGDLSELDMSHVTLSYAELPPSLFIGTNLLGANMRGIDIQGSSLNRSNLSKANLESAILDECHVENTIATEACFQNVQA